MGHNIQLTAGRLTVAIQSDADDLEPVVAAAHNEMRWLLDQWIQVEDVVVHPSEFQSDD